jgi:hypothetical protein
VSDILIEAITERVRESEDAIVLLADLTDNLPAAERATQTLREAVELVRCLRRLVPGRSVQEIHRAFGAPGDFGYETPIGAALARLYRGEE